MRPNEVAFFENYIAHHPDSAMLPKLAAIYIENGEWELAIDCCQKELAARPYSPYGQFLWGLAALKNNNVPLALEKFQATIQRDPSFLAAYYHLITVGQNYLDDTTYRQYLLKIQQLNPLDKTIIAKLAESPQKATPTPPPIAIPTPEPETPTPALEEPQWEASEVNQMEEPVPATSPYISEEEAHLGPLEPEEWQQTEPTEMEPSPEPTQPPIGGAPSSLTELFQKLKTKSIDELHAEATGAIPQPHPEPAPASPVPPEPTFTTEEPPAPSPGASNLSQLFEKLRTTPIDQLQAEAEQTPPLILSEPTASAPAAEPNVSETRAIAAEPSQPLAEAKKAPSRKKREPKKAETTNDGEITIKFPIPTWTLVEVLKKQQLYSQALEIIAMIEKKSQKPSDLEKARQNREEIERLMAEE